jgi:type I restriction enzyme, S subunit
VKDRSSLRPKFLAAYLNYFKDQLLVPLMTGAANMSFTLQRLAGVPVIYPGIEEQERLLSILEQSEAIERLRMQSHRLSATLVLAHFEHMFGPVNESSAYLQMKRLKDVVSVFGGATPAKDRPDLWNNGVIPWITPKDMKANVITSASDYVSPLALQKSSLKMIPPNSVLIVVRGMILGRTIPIRENKVPVVINQDMKGLVPSKGLLPMYLRWAVQSREQLLLSRVSTAGHGTKKLDMDQLMSIELPVPPMERQVKFSETVEAVEQYGEVYEVARSDSQRLSASLWQSCFQPATTMFLASS